MSTWSFRVTGWFVLSAYQDRESRHWRLILLRANASDSTLSPCPHSRAATYTKATSQTSTQYLASRRLLSSTNGAFMEAHVQPSEQLQKLTPICASSTPELGCPLRILHTFRLIIRTAIVQNAKGLGDPLKSIYQNSWINRGRSTKAHSSPANGM